MFINKVNKVVKNDEMKGFQSKFFARKSYKIAQKYMISRAVFGVGYLLHIYNQTTNNFFNTFGCKLKKRGIVF